MKVNLDDLRRLHEESKRFGAGSKQWIEFANAMFDSFPSIYETAKHLNAVVRTAQALSTRDDFWDAVQEAGWIMPAEIDDLRDAIEAAK